MTRPARLSSREGVPQTAGSTASKPRAAKKRTSPTRPPGTAPAPVPTLFAAVNERSICASARRVWAQLGFPAREAEYILAELGTAQLSEYLEQLQRHRLRRLAVVRAIADREIQLKFVWELREEALHALRIGRLAVQHQRGLAHALLDLRSRTVEVAGRANEWRRTLVVAAPCTYGEADYFAKILHNDVPAGGARSALSEAPAACAPGDDELPVFLRRHAAQGAALGRRDLLFSPTSFRLLARVLGFQHAVDDAARSPEQRLALLLGAGSDAADAFLRHALALSGRADAESVFAYAAFQTIRGDAEALRRAEEEKERAARKGLGCHTIPLDATGYTPGPSTRGGLYFPLEPGPADPSGRPPTPEPGALHVGVDMSDPFSSPRSACTVIASPTPREPACPLPDAAGGG